MSHLVDHREEGRRSLKLPHLRGRRVDGAALNVAQRQRHVPPRAAEPTADGAVRLREEKEGKGEEGEEGRYACEKRGKGKGGREVHLREEREGKGRKGRREVLAGT